MINITERTGCLIYTPHTMIKILRRGMYQLRETEKSKKILFLDSIKTFAWENETITLCHYSKKRSSPINLIALGKYFLYEIIDERHLTTGLHLEINLGPKMWQGYLLSKGIPTKKDSIKPITRISELITVSGYN